jgi:hypothetical protein
MLTSQQFSGGTRSPQPGDIHRKASTEVHPSIAMEAERTWLARCAPIFMQPEVDVRKGNGLVKVFFEFWKDGEKSLSCDLVVVLEVRLRIPPLYNHHIWWSTPADTIWFQDYFSWNTFHS